MARKISDEAMIKATGHGPDHWFPILDKLAKDEMPRSELTMKFWRENEADLSAWWAQMTTVEWERERGLRQVNQSCDGDFQVGVQKVMPGDEMSTWQAVKSTNWLEGLVYEEGHQFDSHGVLCTVRAVRPGKMLRIWFGEGSEKSVLEVMFVPSKEKCAVRFRHHQLDSEAEVEISRARWKEVLSQIAENA